MFTYKTPSELAQKCAALGFSLPFSSDTSALRRPVTLPREGVTLKNSIVYHPMEANDALERSPLQDETLTQTANNFNFHAMEGNDASERSPLSEVKLTQTANNFNLNAMEERRETTEAAQPTIVTEAAQTPSVTSPEGAPSQRTVDRYVRFARSGAGTVWVEATVVTPEARAISRQLWLNADNAPAFKALSDAVHEAAPDCKLILQLTHSGRFTRTNGVSTPLIAYHNPYMNKKLNVPPELPVLEDAYLAALPAKFAAAASLAVKCGFDGVDVKCCHRYLFSELLSAYDRAGEYGGSFENRTRLLLDSILAVKSVVPRDFIVACRLNLYDGFEYPYGFGVKKIAGSTEPDLTETIALVKSLYRAGVSLVNVTMGSPYVNPNVNRPYDGNPTDRPAEEPLAGVHRMLSLCAEVKAACPEMLFVGTGFSYLRQFAPNVAAGVLDSGMADAVGFGRLIYSYPEVAADMLNGRFDSRKSCVSCCKCAYLLRGGEEAGCVVREPYYTEVYKRFEAKKAGAKK